MGKRTYKTISKMFLLLGAMIMIIASAGLSAPRRVLPIINGQQLGYAKNHVLVQLKDGKSTRSLNSFLAKFNAKLTDRKVGDSFYIVNLPANITADQVVNKKISLASTYDSIKDIRFDYKRYLSVITPNDPEYANQWPLQKNSQIFAPEAWDYFIQSTTKEIVVAVLDTGIRDRNNTNPADPGQIWRVRHPDLSGNLLASQGYDYGDYDSDPSPTEYSGFIDYTGHGTHVAGTIAASFNNAKGVAGLVPNGMGGKKVWILPVKVCDYVGNIYDSSLINAIDFCKDVELTSPATDKPMSVNVINMSLGGEESNPLLQDAIKRFTDNGGVVVAASGNDYGAPVFYPAAYEECIAVGAADINQNIAPFSNVGPELDIVAPGVDIPSTYWSPDLTSFKYDDKDVPPAPSSKVNAFNDYLEDTYGNAYVSMSGTSMASPHVAAAAAMLMATGVPGSEVYDILTKTATPLASTLPDPASGYGLLNLFDALAESTVSVNIVSPADDQAIATSKPPVVIKFRNANIDTIKVWLDNTLIVGPVADNPRLPNWKTENYSKSGNIATITFETEVDSNLNIHSVVAEATSTIIPPSPLEPAIAQDTVSFTLRTDIIPKGWNLFSIPLKYDTAYTPEQIFDVNIASLYRWTYANNADGEYARYTLGGSVKQAEASFFPPSIYKNDEVLGSLGSSALMPPAGLGYWLRVGDEEGMPVPSEFGTSLSSAPFQISLHKGWNLIGTPFPYPVSWNVILIEKDGVRLSASEAATKGWITGSIFRWDRDLNAGQGAYVRRTPQTAVMVPWEAQWIKVRLAASKTWPIPDMKLIVPPNPYTGIIP